MLIMVPFCVLIISIISTLLSNSKNAIWAINSFFSASLLVSTGYIVYILCYGNEHTNYSYLNQVDLIRTIFNLNISFVINKINGIFIVMVTVLNFFATIYSVGYMKENFEPNQKSFFIFFNISILASIAIGLANNLITTFIFYEILTLVTYPLVTHNRDKESRESGIKYLQILIGSSTLLFFPAIIITYHFNGGEFIKNSINYPEHIEILVFLLFTFGIAKSGLMPLHGWLTHAMVAPAPVSALLHSVAVVKSGIIVLIKVYTYVFLLQNKNLSFILSIISAISVIMASTYAIKAQELKKVLAYSTISHLSYIIIIISLFTERSVKIAIFYMIAHAIAKITLFFCVGSIYTKTHKKLVKDIRGLFIKMPITGICFVVGAFSMIGLPPTITYYIKHHIFIESAMICNHIIPYVTVISTALTSIYYLKIIYIGFFTFPPDKSKNEANYLMLIPSIITATASLVISLFSHNIIDVFL